MANYYNEIDPFAAAWLRKLIEAGLIPEGDVDERSIINVRADDLRAYRQCHFFAGIGGWSHALRLAGWPDDREIWTGSCPCQPFSVAGKGKGKSDERHLWPIFFRLISECRPDVVMGEQVAGKAGYDWLDGVAADLEGEGYAAGAVDIPACAVDAPHIRQRLYWCAVGHPNAMRELQPQGIISDERGWIGDAGAGDMVNADCAGQREHGRAISIFEEQPSAQRASGDAFDMADANGGGCDGWQETSQRSKERGIIVERVGGCDMADADSQSIRWGRSEEATGETRCHEGEAQQRKRVWSDAWSDGNNFWTDHQWLTGADGKTRRAKPGVRLLVDGVPGRVGRLRGYGNAIVPPLAAEMIKAFMEVAP